MGMVKSGDRVVSSLCPHIHNTSSHLVACGGGLGSLEWWPHASAITQHVVVLTRLATTVGRFCSFV